jgi:hypothetical protein
MPDSIVHLIVQQRLGDDPLAAYGAAGHPYVDLLRAEPCSPYASFGSQGPDFLWFSVREYGDAIAKFTHFVFKVYRAFEPLITFYMAPIVHPPMSSAADVDDAYLLWQTWFKRSTSIRTIDLPPPPIPPGAGTLNLINDYISGFPAFPDGPSGGGGSACGVLSQPFLTSQYGSSKC